MVYLISKQVESDGSQSGSSLSLRTSMPQNPGACPSSEVRSTSNSSHGASTVSGGNRGQLEGANHRSVQRSISASSSSKSRKHSTATEQQKNVSSNNFFHFSRLLGKFSLFFPTDDPSPASTVNNSYPQQSNFKRQNTMDTATIKENSSRIIGSRPATALTPSSKATMASTDAGRILAVFLTTFELRVGRLSNFPRFVNSKVSNH